MEMKNDHKKDKDIEIIGFFNCDTKVITDSVSFIWTIHNYSLLNKKNGDRVYSHYYSMKNNPIQVSLCLYPEGFRKEDKDSTSVYVAVDFSEPYKQLKFSLEVEILGKRNETLFSKRTTALYVKSDNEMRGFSSFIKNKDLLDEKKQYVRDNKLVLKCTATVGIAEKTKSMDTKIIEPSAKKAKSVSYCQKLLEENKYSDITLIVDDKNINAHKNMLSISSPVMASMLYDKKESKINSLEIKDFSYEVIQGMVKFVYTNKVDNISDIANQLIYAAKKYGITDLSNYCEEELYKSINQENFLTLLIIADDCDALILKKKIITFISKNLKKFTENEECMKLTSTRSGLLFEILRGIAVSNTK